MITKIYIAATASAEKPNMPNNQVSPNIGNSTNNARIDVLEKMMYRKYVKILILHLLCLYTKLWVLEIWNSNFDKVASD